MKTTQYIPGADLKVGDTVDCGHDWLVVTHFTTYHLGLPTTGPGRIAHFSAGSPMAIYDNRPVRTRVA